MDRDGVGIVELARSRLSDRRGRVAAPARQHPHRRAPPPPHRHDSPQLRRATTRAGAARARRHRSQDEARLPRARRTTRSRGRPRVGRLPHSLAEETQENRPMTRIVLLAVLLASSAARAEDPEVENIMARFSDEPSIREVQVAAIEYYNVSPDTIRSLRSKARSKALMPGLSLGGSAWKQSSSLAVDDIIYRAVGIARYEDQNGVFMGANATLSWGLDKLVFTAEELDVMPPIGTQGAI